MLGIGLWALAVGLMAALYVWRPRVRRYPHYGYLGLAVIVIAEVWTLRGREPVATFFTPIAWTGYIAVLDAAVYALAGSSLLHRGREFLAVAAFSAPFWLLFEAYNLRLENWTYVGLPVRPAPRYFGYAWAFSTIWPAMLETAMFLQAAGLWQKEYRRVKVSVPTRRILVGLGAAMLLLPLLAPRWAAGYLFGLVWLGFFFLLDPVNSRLQAASLLDDLEQGRRGRLYSLLWAGAIAGIFWEFWNYWASSKWIYIFPILQSAKIFEMPVPGYLGFPPFAVECFCAYVFLAALAGRLGATRKPNHVLAL